MSASVLESFSKRVVDRVQGEGWIEVVVPIVLPLVVELINRCFDSRDELAVFCGGKRSQLQTAGLRIRCNQAAREAGIRGPMRVQRAGSALVNAVVDEMDAAAGLAGDGGLDVFREAIDEAASV